MKEKKNIYFIQGDICKKKILKKIIKTIQQHKIKVIISDISPNLTGIKEIDNPKNMSIYINILKICKKKLEKNGTLVSKVFLSKNFSIITKKIKTLFKYIKFIKPKSSYQSSKEIYIIGLKYKKNIW